MDRFSLAGKTALVTGASRGIGRAIALGYAESGADVALLARSADTLDAISGDIRAMGRAAVALPCDVTRPDEIEAAVARALEELGRLDVLVNNAGGPVFNAPFLDIRPEGWRRVLDLNLTSVVGFCQAVGRHMVERATGSIINVDTIGARHAAPLLAPYCASKAAVVNLTATLAQEWGSAGVRVNAVSPGMISTGLNRRLLEREDVADAIAHRVPLRRWGEPDDLVGVAIWLASDASVYVSGAHIAIDGGMAAVAPQAPSGLTRD